MKSLNLSPSNYFILIHRDAKITTQTQWKMQRCVMRGHFSPNAKWTNEVWGLAMFNDGDRFVSCSDDASVRIYSIKERKQLACFRTLYGIRFRLNFRRKGITCPKR